MSSWLRIHSRTAIVFDSRSYANLADVLPVQLADSGNAQHMAVIKDFSIPVDGSNAPPSAPVFTTHPQDRTIGEGGTVSFTAAASGSPAPTYQWRGMAQTWRAQFHHLYP